MRLALTIEYQGTRYHGFQYQTNANSVQEELENSIERLTGRKTRITAAGRTDAGVHARNQVATFDTSSGLETNRIARGMNHYLPEDIVVKKVVQVGKSFDPRRDAKSRIYRYSILNSKFQSPLKRLYTHCVIGNLDRDLMCEGAVLFLGEHDFSKFAGKVENNKTTVRMIYRSEWIYEPEMLTYEVEGNAFLPHQVRRMVGSLVDLGRGNLKLREVQDLINGEGSARSNAMPAKGLCLEKIIYENYL